MTAITIYTTALCPYCHRAKKLLKSKGVDFEEIDVTFKPNQRAQMRDRAGGKNTVPQIFVGDDHIGDCDKIHTLDKTGELDALLNRSTSNESHDGKS